MSSVIEVLRNRERLAAELREGAVFDLPDALTDNADHLGHLFERGTAAHLDALGTLRISVFREYPYLYDGSLEYERDYLRVYLRSKGSLVVLAFDDDRVVGATTCLPMLDEGPEFQAAFVKAGYDLSMICYFGESILLPQYRGQGVGVRFPGDDKTRLLKLKIEEILGAMIGSDRPSTGALVGGNGHHGEPIGGGSQ